MYARSGEERFETDIGQVVSPLRSASVSGHRRSTSDYAAALGLGVPISPSQPTALTSPPSHALPAADGASAALAAAPLSVDEPTAVVRAVRLVVPARPSALLPTRPWFLVGWWTRAGPAVAAAGAAPVDDGMMRLPLLGPVKKGSDDGTATPTSEVSVTGVLFVAATTVLFVHAVAVGVGSVPEL